eukprot:TRINITY_DN16978_c1_g1_i2.p1 TRINITY_DN16978_c1_g1~~TRINITY_DN16978_c1_g1_i2.p1  ORF type:complete len:149 (-),score=1.78 TRINITY_DN16978_c1_g1_i2:221-667(-)
MKKIVGWFICLYIQLYWQIVTSEQGDDNTDKTLFCNITSACIPCAKVEQKLDYCQSTGYRQRLVCVVENSSSNVSHQWSIIAHKHGSGGKHSIGDKFSSGRSCTTGVAYTLTSSNFKNMSVIQFELLMLIVFICALPVYLWRRRVLRL